MDARRQGSDTRSRLRWWALWGLLTAAVLGAGILLAETFVVQILTVSSGSMLPTLRPGDSVLINRLAYALSSPQRGDIIAFRFPRAAGREFLKRVVGLPGDVVAELDGRFWINGVPLGVLLMRVPPVQDDTPPLNLAPRRVPANHLYVLGDNRNASLDSRYWGMVTERDVIGKAVAIPWSEGRHWWDVRWVRVGHRLR